MTVSHLGCGFCCKWAKTQLSFASAKYNTLLAWLTSSSGIDSSGANLMAQIITRMSLISSEICLLSLICARSLFRHQHLWKERDIFSVFLMKTAEWRFRGPQMAQFVKVPPLEPNLMARDMGGADSQAHHVSKSVRTVSSGILQLMGPPSPGAGCAVSLTFQRRRWSPQAESGLSVAISILLMGPGNVKILYRWSLMKSADTSSSAGPQLAAIAAS